MSASSLSEREVEWRKANFHWIWRGDFACQWYSTLNEGTLINPGVRKALSQPFSSRLFQSLVAQMFKMNPYYVLSSFIKGCFYDNIFCATVLFFFEKHFKNYSWRTCFFQTMLLCLFNVAFPFIYPSGSSLPTFHFCISACFHEFNKSPCRVLQCFKWSSDVTQLVFINFIG